MIAALELDLERESDVRGELEEMTREFERQLRELQNQHEGEDSTFVTLFCQAKQCRGVVLASVVTFQLACTCMSSLGFKFVAYTCTYT